MKVYFLSSIPCALTVGGAYFGVTDAFERFAELSLTDNLFIEFTPENALPVRFFLNENVRFSPPIGCDVYLLKDAIALYAHGFTPCDFTLKPIAQARDKTCLATVFAQGVVQLSVETGNELFIATLPPSFARCDIEFYHDLLVLHTETHLAVYTLRAEKLFCERISAYTLRDDLLVADLPLCDALGRSATCEYHLTPSSCERQRITIRQTRSIDGDVALEKINAELLPFAFFETLLFGGDFAQLLSPELMDKAEDLHSFLGEFIAVAPTRSPNVCALTYKKDERLFVVKEFAVDVEEGKICDVRCL